MNAEELFYQGTEHMEAGRNLEAVNSYTKCLALNPDLYEAHLNLGNVYYSLEQFDNAVRHYLEAARTNPTEAMAFQNLGNAYVQLKKFDAAIDAYNKGLKRQPDHALLEKYIENAKNLQHRAQNPEVAKPQKSSIDDIETTDKPLGDESVVYDPKVFTPKDAQEAKLFMLSSESDINSSERWDKETPVIVDQILENIEINEGSLLLDFGCGIGRVSKELINRTNCKVIGVDIDAKMQALAIDYVDSPNFSACFPEQLDLYAAKGMKIDAAISVWVLQHVFNPEIEIDRIVKLLSANSKFFVLNVKHRCVPTNKGWASDGVEIDSLLREKLEISAGVSQEELVEATSEEIAPRAFGNFYRLP